MQATNSEVVLGGVFSGGAAGNRRHGGAFHTQRHGSHILQHTVWKNTQAASQNTRQEVQEDARVDGEL